MVRYTGYILLVVSCLLFIAVLVVPWLGFSGKQVAGITAALIIIGEVLFYLSLFILGKSFYAKLKARLKFRKSKKGIPEVSSPNDKNLTEGNI